MYTILAIAGGGAIGALLRHALNNAVSGPAGSAFPWGILLCNVLGSFVMGLLIALFAGVWEPPQEIKTFLTVGLLGGFTTFSSYSMDTVLLFERGAYGAAAFYAAGSVVLAVAALAGGMVLVRGLAP